jgi:hypothetical protein
MTTLDISNQNIRQLRWHLERNFIMKQPHDMDPIIPLYMYFKVLASCLWLLLTFTCYQLTTTIMQQELV